MVKMRIVSKLRRKLDPFYERSGLAAAAYKLRDLQTFRPDDRFPLELVRRKPDSIRREIGPHPSRGVAMHSANPMVLTVFEIAICSSFIAVISGISNYLLSAMAYSLATWANESM